MVPMKFKSGNECCTPSHTRTSNLEKSDEGESTERSKDKTRQRVENDEKIFKTLY